MIFLLPLFPTEVFSLSWEFWYEEEDSQVSESWLGLFAFVFLFYCLSSYCRVSLSSCRPLPSLNPPPTFGQSSDAPMCAESRDLGCTVDEVAVRPGDDAAADSLTLEVTTATAVGASEEAARAS